MTDRTMDHTGTRQEGFALVLAVLSLMLLTFLGLTLAATTSTELQIATNYRWSQQALYNAEAGLEAGKLVLRNITNPDFTDLLPAARGPAWKVSDVALPATPAAPVGASDPGLRNYENGGCDRRGGAIGYGVILSDDGGLSTDPQGDLQYRSTLFGQRLNGAVTVWVRRGITIDTATGAISDDAQSNAVVMTAEGVAPYDEGGVTMAFARANMAVRVLEVSVLRAPGGGEPCEAYGGPGAGVSGSGFAKCARPPGGCAASDVIKGAAGQAARGVGGTLDHAGDVTGDTGSLCATSVE